MIYEESKSLISDIINTKDYARLLKVCNLKKAISKGLADKKLDSNYEEKAVQHIVYNGELRSILLKKYFNI